jgi:hypothetical protein
VGPFASTASGVHRDAKGESVLAQSPLLMTPLPSQSAGSAVPLEVLSEEELHPLVMTGLIVNPLTGRGIPINGDLYAEMVGQGFDPDLKAGRLKPPNGLLIGLGSPGEGDGSRAIGSVRRRNRDLIL